jgi:hypothetical protein
MENKFPCRECLVKVCCVKDCSSLLESPRIIDMYINLYNTCPDCGSNLNNNGYISKSLVLCFSCRRAFRKTTVVKPLDETAVSMIINKTRNFNAFDIGPPKIITKIQVPKNNPQLPSMEETHDIKFGRITKEESIYIIEKLKDKIKEGVRKKDVLKNEIIEMKIEKYTIKPTMRSLKNASLII